MGFIAFVLVAVMLGFIFIGVPITFSLGSASILARVAEGGLQNIPFDIAASRMVYGISSFTWVAIPLFLFLGQLMNSSGLTDRIFKFALTVVGHIKGGLAHVNVLASLIFAGMSGSASADAAGLGRVVVPAMEKAGYHRLYAATVTAASATIGPILPPSIPAIIYAGVAQVSVLKMFIGAIVPALMLTAVMMMMCTFYAHKYDHPKQERATFPEFATATRRSFAAIIAPLLLIVGMYSGVFTATEAGAVGVAYAILLSFFYRTFKWKDFMKDVHGTAVDSGIILLLIAMVGFYGWALTRYRIPQFVFESITSLTESPILIILFINLVLLVAGMLMSTSPSLLILVPLMLPLVNSIGMDLHVFGIMCILNLVMGSMTPPVGNVLIILCRVAKVPYEKLTISLIPWYIPFVITIILIVTFPQIVLWLPETLGL